MQDTRRVLHEILRLAMNISWKRKLINQQQHVTLPTVSSKFAFRRIKIIGHCIRHPEEITSNQCSGNLQSGEEV